MSSATPHRLPLAGALRLGRPSDIWFKPALSAVVSVAPPNLTLLALGRLDLAMYTMAGSLCALYGHNRPYAARARTLAWVVLGMVGGLAVALLASALTTNAVVLVTVGAVLAAVQKTVCDATRVGPPGNVVLTFISSASLFAPQTLGGLPGHIGLALAAGAWAWLVCMAPGLLRPHGPERRATAQALNAAAAYAATRGTGDGHARARAACAAAIHGAWQSLLAAGARPDGTRRALEHLLVRAEVALAAPADTDPERLRAWARALRGTGRVPRVAPTGAAADELLGVAAEQPLPPRSLRHRLAPSPRWPYAPRSAAPSPDTPPSPSASAAPTGRWSPPRPSTRPTSPSPGAGPSSGSSATSSASSSSPPSPRSPICTPPPWCWSRSPSTSAPRR